MRPLLAPWVANFDGWGSHDQWLSLRIHYAGGRKIMPEVTINPELLEIVQSLELSNDMNISLAKLLEKEMQRELAVYEHMAENFRTQYGMTFEEFAHSALLQEPSFSIENSRIPTTGQSSSWSGPHRY
jgi:hypothetical protein